MDSGLRWNDPVGDGWGKSIEGWWRGLAARAQCMPHPLKHHSEVYGHQAELRQ